MLLHYNGPRASVRVRVENATIEHHKGAMFEYPEALAKDLLESPKHDFRAATAEEEKSWSEGKKKPPKKNAQN